MYVQESYRTLGNEKPFVKGLVHRLTWSENQHKTNELQVKGTHFLILKFMSGRRKLAGMLPGDWDTDGDHFLIPDYFGNVSIEQQYFGILSING